MHDVYHDWEYIRLVENIIENGVWKNDRTNTGTLSTFAQQMRFNLRHNSIPLLTTKKMHVRSIIHEILWYLKGDTNVKYLNDNNVTIWNEWADENGDLGPVYGEQWRKWKRPTGATINYLTDPPKAEVEWGYIDQIADVINRLRTNPEDRRIVVNAWNVGELDQMALPPCHMAFQFWSAHGRLKCHLYQRSCDVGLGVPFNIVQYSILTHMIAHVTGLIADEFIWTGGDTHIYVNHLPQLHEQITRAPYPSPTLWLNPEAKEIDDFTFDDIKIVGYDMHHSAIKMEVAV
jgi:thymidylate synthase